VVKQHLARTYDRFVQRVASGRELSRQAVKRVAQGRVWSGKAALEHKLVDRLGGLLKAVEDAKRLAKLPSSAKTAIYPRPKTWIERLQESLGASDTRARTTTRVLLELAGEVPARQLRRLLLALRAWEGERALAWMPVILRVR
jgi:protease-4